MPKRTSVLILILAVVTGALVYLAISANRGPSTTTTQNQVPTPTPVEKTATVFFNPTTIDLSQAQQSVTTTVDVMVDSGGSAITGVQAELQFDPKSITKVVLTPAVDGTSFFGSNSNVLLNEIVSEIGRISYAVAIAPGASAKSGVGKIATLSFQKAALSKTPTTTVFLLDKSLVTVPGANESALKGTTPLTILFGQTTTQTSPFVPRTTTSPAQ